METKKNGICWMRVMKNISYIIAPFLLASLILSVVSVLYVNESGRIKEISKMDDNSSYYETITFAEKYLNSIEGKIQRVRNIQSYQQNLKEVKNTSQQELELTERYSYYYNNHYAVDSDGKKVEVYYESNADNFIYFIINHKNNEIYSNIEYDLFHTTLQSLKDEILSNERYWIYENGKVNTTIDKINDKNIKQIGFYETIKAGDYTIYTALSDNYPYNDSYLGDYILFSIVKNQYQNAIFNIPIAIIMLIVLAVIVLIGIGKTRDGIHLTWFDKLPIEISITILGIITFLFCCITFGIGTNIAAIVSIICIILGLIGIYVSMIFLLETIVKRVKTHTFIKTTFAYFVYQKMKLIFSNMDISLKVGTIFAGFVLSNWIIFAIFQDEPFIAFLLLMTLYALSFIYVLKRVIWQRKINNAIEQIYKGNTTVRLDETELKGESKKVAVQVNDIAGGLSNAVKEQLKSERLKTELITNVSHDIKTPLTSIINYVDLLKKEGITTEKAEEYLAILDNKSQRLKKLTEDLVEASKASSGNIKMNMEKLEVNELIKQVSAEFEDKFKTHRLEEIVTFTKEPVYIKADNRYMYRVLENMYSNVSKYAMENSRVYTDIIEHGNNVIIQIKNISKEKLNITADELMQRFVRGDSSRNTEGSGLGLSIANSLTELQNGQFHIYLDGDLFKITIGFHKNFE